MATFALPAQAEKIEGNGTVITKEIRVDDYSGVSMGGLRNGGDSFSFTDLFKRTLKSGKDIHKERYPIGKNLYDIAVFEIERNKFVGAVITDVTQTEMKREQIAKKAHEVIEKNIATVQNIACLLGEHMVDTELLLSQIAQGYEDNAPETEDSEITENGEN